MADTPLPHAVAALVTALTEPTGAALAQWAAQQRPEPPAPRNDLLAQHGCHAALAAAVDAASLHANALLGQAVDALEQLPVGRQGRLRALKRATGERACQRQVSVSARLQGNKRGTHSVRPCRLLLYKPSCCSWWTCSKLSNGCRRCVAPAVPAAQSAHCAVEVHRLKADWTAYPLALQWH